MLQKPAFPQHLTESAKRKADSGAARLLELPALTQQPVLTIDGTPDAGYVMRILKAYRENCNVMWSSSPPSPIWEQMNKDQQARAVLLDKAIATIGSSNAAMSDHADSERGAQKR